jgi:uncharacterized repeat protein (TIGR03833 family)
MNYIPPNHMGCIMSGDGTLRKNIRVGLPVAIVQKQHQKTGKLTEGVVSRILTKSKKHPHGIKVKLMDGTVGRVKKILSANSQES